MKPKEYLSEYTKDGHVYLKEIVQQMCIDFSSMVEFGQASGNFNYTNFEHLILQLNQKMCSINLRLKQFNVQIEAEHWEYIFTSTIAKLRDEIFGEYLAAQKEKA